MEEIIRTPARITLTAVTLLVASLGLSACALLDQGPERDADGQVTETSVISSTDLLVGDCFSFVDDADLAEASATPCTQEHRYVVIGQGTLSAAKVADAGGLQNAVSTACAESFEAFKATAAEGAKPEQEFIVSARQEDGKEVTDYSCVATDAAGNAAG